MNPILYIEHLVRNFGGLMAVSDVSLSVGPGERRAIIGPNGAGKTTLFNLISGQTPVVSGSVFLDGQDVTRLADYQRANLGLGRTFQRNNLFFGLSVFENVRLAAQHRHRISRRCFAPASRFAAVNEAALELLERVGLADRAADLARSLAYGQQRALEIALALANQPKVLLLDEPTAGMSPAETAEMVELIGSLPRDLTMLIIEHDMDVIFSLATTITVLHYGQVLAEGTPAEVKKNRRVQEVYLGQGEGETGRRGDREHPRIEDRG
jgi:branched-chain amino acid transport system ATP-binding protein